MNYGRIYNRRPEKGSSNGGGPSMKSIAKQMGVDPKHLGKEAENMWQMLEDLSTNDPAAYREFIQKQLKEGPPPAPSTPSFTPTPGFVVKISTDTGRKFFVNVCWHQALDLPKTSQGRNVPENARDLPSTSNLQIPLAVGKPRELRDQNNTECWAVDAAFHPWVSKRTEFDSGFKQQVVNLALIWVEKELNIKLKHPGKLIRSKYKGGAGQAAVPFPVPSPEPQEPPKEQVAAANILQNPSALLKQLSQPIEEKPAEISLPTKPVAKKKKPLIEEIPPKKSNVVKKGFLNTSAVKSLYPKGSSEGSKPSAYAKLMDRSKVVDMSHLSREDTQKAMEQHASGPEKKQVEEDHGDFEFEQLCAASEPDLITRKAAVDRDAIEEQFLKMAKAFS